MNRKSRKKWGIKQVAPFKKQLTGFNIAAESLKNTLKEAQLNLIMNQNKEVPDIKSIAESKHAVAIAEAEYRKAKDKRAQWFTKVPFPVSKLGVSFA